MTYLGRKQGGKGPVSPHFTCHLTKENGAVVHTHTVTQKGRNEPRADLLGQSLATPWELFLCTG